MRGPVYEPSHCIVCGHADSEVVADAEDIRREVEALWAFHERRLKPGVPVERLRDRVSFSQHAPFRLVACAERAIRVPNGAFYGKWSRRDWPVARALLAHNNLLTFPYRWGFTPKSLRALLTASGFHTVSMVGDVLVPTADLWTRPWARVEERLVKRLLKGLGRLGPDAAPWFEIYATTAPETA